MNDSEYWKERFRLLEEAQNQQGLHCYADIEKQYRQAQRQIETQIQAWYGRFVSNNNITIQEARKLLTNRELAELKWDINQYIQYGEENVLIDVWVKELENASARFHINRLEALKLQTQQNLEIMFGNQLDSIDSAMRGIYKSGYYHTAFELQKGIGIGWDFFTLNDRTINKVINKPWAADGKNFSQRIWSNRQKLVNELNTELTRNIILGEDPQKAITAIARKMKTSKSAAGRLVMTEEAFFSSAAQRDCFAELDVEQFEVVATLDSHTSEICQDMDGQHFPMSQWEVGVTAPPFHVYCRSTTVPFFDDEFDSVGERAARSEDGKTYYVPANMTYKQWKQSFVDGNKQDLQEVVPDKPKQEDYDSFIKYKHARDEWNAKYGQQVQQKSIYISISKENKTRRKQLLYSGRQNAVKQTMKDLNFTQEKAEKIQDAMDFYTSSGYKEVRNKNSNWDKAINARTELETFISKAPSYDGAIYRGTPLDELREPKFREKLKVGAEIDMEGISSWSSKEKVAVDFATRKDLPTSVLYVCNNNKTGVGIQHLSLNNTESEVLQSSASKFIIKNVTNKYIRSGYDDNKKVELIIVEVEEKV